jgi:hypothetical protein
MSMFNEDVICMACKEKERQRPDYRKAVEADNEAEAYEQTDKMLSEGAIRFDDEPYLKTECSIKPVISCLTPCDIDTTYTRGTDSHFGQDNIFKL